MEKGKIKLIMYIFKIQKSRESCSSKRGLFVNLTLNALIYKFSTFYNQKNNCIVKLY